MHTFILSSDVPSAFSNQSVSIGSSKPLNVKQSLASVPVLAIISYDVWRINFSLVDYTSGKGGLDHTTRILSLYCRSGEKLGASSCGGSLVPRSGVALEEHKVTRFWFHAVVLASAVLWQRGF